jgi:DNA (cytosine-5)-methyltransferase 1
MPFASLSDITHGELFAGIAGFSLGFEKSGIKTLWHVEIDKNCRSVLNKHYPGSLILSDIRDVGRHNLPFVNIISFGSPCQGLSVAGKRKGFNDDRSNLFFEAIRVVDELKPDFAVWENVPGALSSNSGRDFATALSEFRRIGARDIAWRIIDAQYCGVAQRRRRVFLVADFRGERAAEILFESESSPWDTPPSRKEGAELARDVAATIRSGGKGGIPSAREDGYELVSFAPQAGGKTGLNINENLSGTLQENQVMAVAFQQNTRDEVRLMNGDGQIAGALSAQPGMKQQSYIAWDGRNFNNTGEFTSTLQAKKGGGYSLSYQPLINVRRLTPIECERLQGFPDNYTAGQSDSARYRQLGNAVAVPVARWLGRRILDLRIN